MTSIFARFDGKTIMLNDKTFSSLDELKNILIKQFGLTIHPDNCFIMEDSNKLLTNLNIKREFTNIELIVKIKGGIIDGIFNMLMGIVKLVGSLFKILEFFIKAFISVIEMLPLIFDPPRLIDDVLFAISSSLKLVFSKFGGDVRNATSTPEDDNQETGPFGVSNSNRAEFTCMDPTWSTILLLIVCPPLAIIYKLGFWAGFISSIICGVLCVKLFYFPGLLFAILHVLC
jgi:hypothetical protein